MTILVESVRSNCEVSTTNGANPDNNNNNNNNSSFISTADNPQLIFYNKLPRRSLRSVVWSYQSNELYDSNSEPDVDRIAAVVNGIRQKIVRLMRRGKQMLK